MATRGSHNCYVFISVDVRGASKKFVDFVNKNKSIDAIYLKLQFVFAVNLIRTNGERFR